VFCPHSPHSILTACAPLYVAPCPAPLPLLQARIQGETNDAKNALEAYIYGLRNRLSDALAPHIREEAKAALLEKLEALEVGGWLV
jgi:hypothetical protein